MTFDGKAAGKIMRQVHEMSLKILDEYISNGKRDFTIEICDVVQIKKQQKIIDHLVGALEKCESIFQNMGMGMDFSPNEARTALQEHRAMIGDEK